MATNEFEGKKSQKNLYLFGRIIKLANAGNATRSVLLFFSATKLFSMATILQLKVVKRRLFERELAALKSLYSLTVTTPLAHFSLSFESNLGFL